jgi:hypothetical protein
MANKKYETISDTDTLASIATKYKTSEPVLKAFNLPTTDFKSGARIEIPKNATSVADNTSLGTVYAMIGYDNATRYISSNNDTIKYYIDENTTNMNSSEIQELGKIVQAAQAQAQAQAQTAQAQTAQAQTAQAQTAQAQTAQAQTALKQLKQLKQPQQ